MREFYDHVQRFFAGHKITEHQWEKSYISELYPIFRVLEVEPGPKESNWIYIS